VQALNSFNHSTIDFKLEADAIRNGNSIQLIYQIADLKNLLKLPPAFTTNEKEISREDGLWNETCFEMFLRTKEKTHYYEFNFSLKPAWNEYSFNNYRHPQPPKPCYDISLKNLNWDGQNLKIDLYGFSTLEKFEISLTAVLKESSGAVHYMALKHAGTEPDFHHADSFVLKR
jgi:hypothetical protein